MVKVIQIIDSLNLGGAEVLAVNIANELSAQNIQSYICVTRKEGSLKDNINAGVGYIFLNRKNVIDVKAVFKLHKFIVKNKINVIHAHSTSYFIAFCIKMLNPKLTIIWHDHFGNSEFLNQRKSNVLSITSYSFSAIIAVNLGLKNWSEKKLNCKKVIFIKNFPFFNNKKKQTKLLGNNKHRIVHVAGYREQKDHVNLLKAFKLILIDNPQWSLHLIGKNYEDDYGKKISNLIIKEGLSNSVFEYGPRTDIKYILDQCTIGVLSSKSEGLPVALLEYGLAKLPVVVTNVGDCKKVVKDSKYIVKSNDSISLAKAIKLLISDEEERENNSNSVHDIIKNEFSKENVINQLINIYNKNC